MVVGPTSSAFPSSFLSFLAAYSKSVFLRRSLREVTGGTDVWQLQRPLGPCPTSVSAGSLNPFSFSAEDYKHRATYTGFFGRSGAFVGSLT